MLRRLFAIVALVLLGAQSPIASFPPGTFSGRAALSGGGVASYTGPGDIVSGAKVWWGLRAYNAAYATGSNPGADVCDVATGLTCSTVNILSTGKFDAATAAALPQCATACNVSKLYDQTGNGQHFTQATNSERPVLTFNCLGTLPCLTFNGSTQRMSVNTSFAFNLGATTSAVAKSTSTGAQQNLIIIGNTAQLGYRNSAANQVFAYNGTVRAATATDGSWHALQAVYNGASSDMNVDGTPTTGTTGVTTDTGVTISVGATNSGSQFCTCTAGELGWWDTTAFSSGNSTSVSSNQHSFWGF